MTMGWLLSSSHLFLIERPTLSRATYEKKNEFRRHVTMTSVIDGEIVEVTIDSITEDFHKLKDFIDYVIKLSKT